MSHLINKNFYNIFCYPDPKVNLRNLLYVIRRPCHGKDNMLESKKEKRKYGMYAGAADRS